MEALQKFTEIENHPNATPTPWIDIRLIRAAPSDREQDWRAPTKGLSGS